MAGLVTVGKNSSVNRINEKLKSYDNWDKQTIIDRQGVLLKLAHEIWKVETLNSAREQASKCGIPDHHACVWKTL